MKRFVSLLLAFLFPVLTIGAILVSASSVTAAGTIPRHGIFASGSVYANILKNDEGSILTQDYETVNLSIFPNTSANTFSTSDGSLYCYNGEGNLYKFNGIDWAESTDISFSNSQKAGQTWSYGGNLYYTFEAETLILENNEWVGYEWDGVNPVDPQYLSVIDNNLYYFNPYLDYQAYRLEGNSFIRDDDFISPPNISNEPFWSDGSNIYYSVDSTHYVRNSDLTWSSVSFTGITSFNGNDIFTDGTYVYLVITGYYRNGIYRLNGTKWERFSDIGASTSSKSRLFYYDNYLYCGKDNSYNRFSFISEAPSSAVTSVNVSSDHESVYPGSTVQYSASVVGTGEYDSSVTWSVSGATSASTIISSSGLLTIADDETAGSLSVVATSVQDTSITGSKTLSILSYPSVDDLVIDPYRVTATAGVPFTQEFTLKYEDGTPVTGFAPEWEIAYTSPDATLPEFDNIPSWVNISDTGVLTLTTDSVADYRIFVYARVGSDLVVGSMVYVSEEATDYLKDIINGSDEQQKEADKGKAEITEKIDELEEIDRVAGGATIPEFDESILDIDNASEGITIMGMLLGYFMNNSVISANLTFAFLFALVAYAIFGKR